MTFTKAIFAASLAAVVIAAPAAQPGNEENVDELLAASKTKPHPAQTQRGPKVAHRAPSARALRSLVLVSAPQNDARAFQTSARTRLLADERERGLQRPVEWA
ncbi:hypothetical protein EDB85DRAFT_2143585 [Lactarius pseudohatsudake]|nr:hypothetical protein EDB85DRAFT_2143585 [Lactarius pseudohatsudake]